jgi:hypothetical protein
MDEDHTLERARETLDGYIVAGTSTVPGKGFEASLRAFGSNLGAPWEVTIGGEGDDGAHDLDIAEDGDIHVCGWQRVGASDDLWVARFTRDGELRGEWIHNGDLGEDDRVQACQTLPGGDVLVAGLVDQSANDGFAYVARIGE